jgi:hypothetical protein
MDRSGRKKHARILASGILIASAYALPALSANSSNLIEDPGFETSTSGFSGQDNSTVVTRSTTSPLAGASSLSVDIPDTGNSVWWFKQFRNGLARSFTISARVRSDLASSPGLNFCAGFYDINGSFTPSCTVVPGAVGDKGVVSVTVPIDPTQPLEKLAIRLEQAGQPIRFTFDTFSAVADVVKEPDPDNPTGPRPVCLPQTNSVYHPTPLSLPNQHPYIVLSPFMQIEGVQNPAYQRLKGYIDSKLGSSDTDNYLATYALLVYYVTGEQKYRDEAIARVDAFVNKFYTDAHTIDPDGKIDEKGKNIRPKLALDTFYALSDYLEPLALVYDRLGDRLTPEQRQRWEQLANDAMENLWVRDPDKQTWFDVTSNFPVQSLWAVCDPGNNYYYNFLQGTTLWALASKNPQWLNLLQQDKFKIVLDYFNQYTGGGGGTREGTGYGTAIRNQLKNYIYWKASTAEDLSTVTPHPRQTIEYWVHATVPTRDRFAPIGDLSRESIPNIYDYQRNLVHEAVVLSPGTDEAKHGAWWLNNNSLRTMSRPENYWSDLMAQTETQVRPTALLYDAHAAGAVFARSSWETDASWVSIVAGKFDQSHAHQEQGSFTFFKGDWLAVSTNIWSHSGIHQETRFNNMLRFNRADGSEIPQNNGTSTLGVSNVSGVITANADMKDVYKSSENAVTSWQRTLVYRPAAHTLHVTDNCAVGSGVTPTFQLHVPVQPTVDANNTVHAGNLDIVPVSRVARPVITSMPSVLEPDDKGVLRVEYDRGYRIDFQSTEGCRFELDLMAH